jgi:hypothetical protein
MTLDRSTYAANVIEVLDRVLDKGIVVDAWVRVALAGIDLITVDARIVVASISTYLTYAGAIATLTPGARPVDRVGRLTVEEQLRKVQRDLDHWLLGSRESRRAEDRFRDELQASRARIVTRAPLKKH